jgi:hypothetical protein
MLTWQYLDEKHFKSLIETTMFRRSEICNVRYRIKELFPRNAELFRGRFETSGTIDRSSENDVSHELHGQTIKGSVNTPKQIVCKQGQL